MALSLLNSYIALTDRQTFSNNDGVMQGKVFRVAADVTGIAVNDVVFYPAESERIVRYNGSEYQVVKQSDVMGKL